MKIQNTSTNRIGGTSGISTASPPAAGPTPAQPLPLVNDGATDHFQLSNLARFAQIASAYGEAPAHVAKLGELSSTVSTGSYQVDAGVVSNSIIDASIRLASYN
jgi:anti-sigma28 factor (negative regulator of flagellin synthesis)